MKRIEFLPKDAPIWSKYCRDYDYLQGKTVYINRFIARYSLAKAFKDSGVSQFLGESTQNLGSSCPLLQLLLCNDADHDCFKAYSFGKKICHLENTSLHTGFVRLDRLN